MFTCAQCNVKFDTVKKLIDHIRTLCLNTSITTTVTCGELNCFRNFSTVSAFRKHLYKNHSSRAIPCTSQLQPVASIIPTARTLNEASISTTIVHPGNEDTANNLSHQVSIFLSTLYANPLIPRSFVQLVIESVHKILA